MTLFGFIFKKKIQQTMSFSNDQLLERVKLIFNKLSLSSQPQQQIIESKFSHLLTSQFHQETFTSISQPQQCCSFIDHTVLKPETTEVQVIQLCKEAKQFHFATVCVQPTYILTCKKELENSNVGIATVIGFPLGANTLETKLFEMKQALELGASEIDFVWNVGNYMNQDYEKVFHELKEAANLSHQFSKPIKVIIESGLLEQLESKYPFAIVDACILCVFANVDFVKTSTGFISNVGGAKLETVKLMKQVVGKSAKLKASGGVRNYEDAKRYIELGGVDRIGTSSSIQICSTQSTTSGKDGKKY